MVEWAWLSGACGLVLGLTGGYFWGMSRNAGKRVKELESELGDTRQEADRYREQVVEHFQGTADLVNDLTEKYRAVYRHLAEGARDLCGNEKLALTAVRDERLLQADDAPAANENGVEVPDADAEAETEHVATAETAMASSVVADETTTGAEDRQQEPPAVVRGHDAPVTPMQREATVH